MIATAWLDMAVTQAAWPPHQHSSVPQHPLARIFTLAVAHPKHADAFLLCLKCILQTGPFNEMLHRGTQVDCYPACPPKVRMQSVTTAAVRQHSLVL